MSGEFTEQRVHVYVYTYHCIIRECDRIAHVQILTTTKFNGYIGCLLSLLTLTERLRFRVYSTRQKSSHYGAVVRSDHSAKYGLTTLTPQHWPFFSVL